MDARCREVPGRVCSLKPVGVFCSYVLCSFRCASFVVFGHELIRVRVNATGN